MNLSARLSPVVALTAAVLMSCADSTGPTTTDQEIEPDILANLGQNPVTRSATGSGQYHTLSGLWRTFSFNGTSKADGTARGRFHFRIHDAQGEGSRIWGDITCLTIEGNQAWLAGYVTKAGNPNHVGRAHGFRVVDNGQGQNATPDQITVTWPGTSDPTFVQPDEYCENKPSQTLHTVESGNVQIHP